MVPKIIFEDDYILILDKPSGMVVNRAESVKGETVQDWVEKKSIKSITPLRSSSFEGQASIKGRSDFEKRSGVVHRLDKETSGVLVVAKTENAFRNLQKQFKDRKVEKTYTALVHGKVEPEEGTVNAPVGRLPWNRERFGVLPGGRKATTRYKRLSVFSLPDGKAGSRFSDRGKSVSRLVRQTDEPENLKQKTENGKQKTEYSLLEVYPETGRTHQIRIHMKYLGHPVVSDSFYTGRKRAAKDRKWCPRLFLHASAISFRHPDANKISSYQSGLPDDLSSSLENLEEIQNNI